MPQTSFPPQAVHRSLNTARAVLKVLAYLAGSPEGVTTGEVARFLGKSAYTAYYLLNSLCQEHFASRSHKGRYFLTNFREHWGPRIAPASPPSLHALHGALDELNRVTGCRAYLVVYDGRVLMLEAVRGKQGQLGVKGAGPEIRGEAHALAVGKAIFAQLSEGELRSYVQFVGLRRFTPRTITNPAEFKAELARVRRERVAFDREEFQENIYCIAAPVTAVDKGEKLLASLGIAVPSGRFKAQGNRLVKMVHEVTSRIDTVSRHPASDDTGRTGGAAGWLPDPQPDAGPASGVHGGPAAIGMER